MAKQELQVQEATSPEANRNEKENQGIQRNQAASAPVRGASVASPFSLMRRFSEDVDRLFGNFFGPSSMGWGDWPSDIAGTSFWPVIDIQHAGDKLLIHAD